TVLSRLLQEKQYDLAYRTFVLTLTPEEEAVAGNIHNGRFLLPPSKRAFDWQIRDHPGMTITYPASSPSDPGSGVHKRFNNTPVRNLSFNQYVALRPGSYELEFTVSASDARLPKGLLWRLVCVGSSGAITE